MGTYPTAPRSAFIAWVGARVNLWEANSAEIGITAAQAAEVKAAHLAAAAAASAQLVAKNAAKAATVEANQTFFAMRLAVSANVSRIKAFAEQADKPGDVYIAANIDPPAPPGPTPPPGQPFEPSVDLLPSGGLRLRWKCVNPGSISGVIYEVQRRMGPSGPFTYIGSVGARSFTDESIPAGFGGVASATYRVTGTRSTQRGLGADFVVNFGVGGGSGITVTAVSTPTQDELKMAA